MPCIIDGNKIIETPIRDILECLQQQLYLQHIDKLRTVEYKQSNARVTCPIHKDGHENTPSCDILLFDKLDANHEVEVCAGTVHCFSCGYKANIVKFVADCLSISYKRATEWLLSFVDYSLISEVREVGNIDLLAEDVQKDNYASLPVITVDELKTYDYIHPYMFQRKLTEDVIEKFDIGYDPVTDAITFPVYVDGKCLFVAKRRVKFKRFDMPVINPKPIYGLDYVTGKEVIICESVINALTCISYGYEAVALFGTGSSVQLEKLNNSSIRSFVLCFDGDEAGRNGAKRFKRNVKNAMITTINVPDGKDANDLSKEEFDKLYSERNFF